jgi:hypothetical protein
VFMSVLVPAHQQGCHARYEVDVYRYGASVRTLRGVNYDIGSPANDNFEILSSSQATPQGALIRLAIYLQKMTTANFSAEFRLQQGKNTIVHEKSSGSFPAGKIVVLEYDIYCT